MIMVDSLVLTSVMQLHFLIRMILRNLYMRLLKQGMPQILLMKRT
ncbi:Uncharacterised protein [Citrobacter koseri]|nr:Uncharacterised protein [Citrobacter koseri]